MGKFLYSIYQFLASVRKTFFVSITILFCGLAYLAWQLNTTEDVTRLLPDTHLPGQDIFTQAGSMLDNIAVMVSANTDVTEPKQLATTGLALIDSIKAPQNQHLYDELIAGFASQDMNNLFDVYYNNLPLYLTAEDYPLLEKRLTEEQISAQLSRNLHNLMSPTGMVMKDMLMKDPLGLASNAMRRLQDLQVDDQFMLSDGFFMTHDHKNLLFFIKPSSNSNTKQTDELSSLLHRLKEQYSTEDINIHFFGKPLVAHGNAERIKKDIVLTVGSALLILTLFLSWYLKSPGRFILIFTPAIAGGLAALAYMSVFTESVSAISLGIGAVILGITVDYALHMYVHLQRSRSVEAVYKDLSLPILISNLTTIAAFLCILWLQVPALTDLGIFASISLFISMIFAVLVLPHLMPVPKAEVSTPTHFPYRVIDKLASYPFHKNHLLVGIAIVLSIAGFFSIGHDYFDKNMDALNYMSDELKASEQLLNKITNDSNKTAFVLSKGESLSAAMEQVEQIDPYIDTLLHSGQIAHKHGPTGFLFSQKTQQEKIADWKNFWTAEKIELAKRLLVTEGGKLGFKPNAFDQFYNLIEQEPAYMSPADEQFVANHFFSNLILESDNQVVIAQMIKVKEIDEVAVLDVLNDKYSALAWSPRYYLQKVVHTLHGNFNWLITASLSVVFIILLLHYGRFELAIIGFVPVLISWFWVLGIMYLSGFYFNIINIIVCTFIFGLGVDYSIFMLNGLQKDIKTGSKELSTYKTSILLSAITTLAGTGVMIFASHPALKSIGALSVVGIVSVVAIVFILQPALFNTLFYKKGKKRVLPFLLKDLLLSTMMFTYFVTGAATMSGLAPLIMIAPIRFKTKQMIFHWLICTFSKGVIEIPWWVKKNYIGRDKLDFSKPALFICNHQSSIDIMLALSLHPKMVILTKNWVQTNVLFRTVVKYAEYYSVENGIDDALMANLRRKIDEGFSIFVYPEGSRTDDGQIKRFKKGAFMLAEQLNLDIMPMLIHGFYECFNKHALRIHDTELYIKFFDRITQPQIAQMGSTMLESTKAMRRFYVEENKKLIWEHVTPYKLRKMLWRNYVLRGPVLEWYVRIKLMLEGYYSEVDSLIPKSGKVVDVGCGYGYLSYLLHFRSADRQVLGLDYDDEKIEVANHAFFKTKDIHFVAADACTYQYPMADAFILYDILHYLPMEKQKVLLDTCARHLNENGMIIVREGDAEQQKHNKTKITEVFSTKILQFNKSVTDLQFTSSSWLAQWAADNQMQMKKIQKAKNTSNQLYLFTKTQL